MYAGWLSTPNVVGITDACSRGEGYILSGPGNNVLSPWGSEWQYMGMRFLLPASTPNLLVKKVDTLVSVAPKSGDATLSHGYFATNGATGNNATGWGGFNFPAGTWGGVQRHRVTVGNAQGARMIDNIISCYGPCEFHGPPLNFHAIEFTLDEGVAPAGAVAEQRGLLDGSVQRGTRTVALSSSDLDSGVRRLQLRTEAGALVAEFTAPDCSFDRPSPCPLSRPQDTLSVDTTKLPEGQQSLEAWVYDVAENRRVTTLPPFVVDNVPDAPAGAEPPRPLTPNNGSGGSPATGQVLPSRKATTIRTRYRKSTTLRGKLVDDAGKPIAGASVDVYERVLAPGAPRAKTATVTTDASGEYVVKTRPGSSRIVEIQFSRERGATSYQSTHQVTIEVQPRLSLRLARGRIAGGGKATLRGKVALDGVRAGSIVEIQASDRGRWLTTGAVRIDDGGRFSWSHRFKIRRGAITFRAVLKPASDLPAISSRSGKVRLRIGA